MKGIVGSSIGKNHNLSEPTTRVESAPFALTTALLWGATSPWLTLSTAPPFWGACTRTPGALLPATGRRRFQRRIVVVAVLRGQTCAVVDRVFSVLLRREISPLPASSILVGAVSASNSPSIRVEFAAFATATSSTAFLRGGIACGRRCQRPPTPSTARVATAQLAAVAQMSYEGEFLSSLADGVSFRGACTRAPSASLPLLGEIGTSGDAAQTAKSSF